MKNGVKCAGRAAEISDLSCSPPSGQAAGATTAQACYSGERGCNFHPAVPSIAQRRAQQTALQKSHHDPKLKKKKNSPKEAAGCGRSSCSELNWRFRGHGPNCVGLLGSGGVSSQLPSCLPDHNFLWGLQHSFIPFKSMQKWPLFSRGQLTIHQIRGVKPKPILTLMSKGNFSLFLIFEPDVAFML